MEKSSSDVETTSVLQNLHEKKAEFDVKATVWLERKSTEPKRAASVVSMSRSQKSFRTTRLGGSVRTGRSSGSGSALSVAKSVVRQEKARLHLRHLQEKYVVLQEKEKLRYQRQEKAELSHKIEMMQAAHALEEASVERQVLEEELNHGGYLCDEELGEPSRKEFLRSPRGKLVINSDLVLSSNKLNNINTPEFNNKDLMLCPTRKSRKLLQIHLCLQQAK